MHCRFISIHLLLYYSSEVFKICMFLHKTSFLQGNPLWHKLSVLLALIAAAKEPLPYSLAKNLLGWTDQEAKEYVAKVSLLFPLRDGRFSVLHKTVIDWLTKKERKGQRFHISATMKQEAQEKLARHCLSLVEEGKDLFPPFKKYPLRFALVHAREVPNNESIRERAASVLLNFPYLLRRVEDSAPKLLDDTRAMETVYKMHTQKDDQHQQRLYRAVSLLRSALSLSMQGLLTNYKQLAGQMVARLMMYEQGTSGESGVAKVQLIMDFLREVRQWSGPEEGGGWWCPMTATYTPAGGALQATLTGHSGPVNCIKYRPMSERSMSVTASDDKTLKVSSVRMFCVYVRVRD